MSKRLKCAQNSSVINVKQTEAAFHFGDWRLSNWPKPLKRPWPWLHDGWRGGSGRRSNCYVLLATRTNQITGRRHLGGDSSLKWPMGGGGGAACDPRVDILVYKHLRELWTLANVSHKLLKKGLEGTCGRWSHLLIVSYLRYKFFRNQTVILSRPTNSR